MLLLYNYSAIYYYRKKKHYSQNMLIIYLNFLYFVRLCFDFCIDMDKKSCDSKFCQKNTRHIPKFLLLLCDNLSNKIVFVFHSPGTLETSFLLDACFHGLSSPAFVVLNS